MATQAPPTQWLTSDGVGGSGDGAHDGHQPLPVKRRNEVLESELVSLSIVASHHMAWGDHMEQCHAAMRVSMWQCVECMCMCMCVCVGSLGTYQLEKVVSQWSQQV